MQQTPTPPNQGWQQPQQPNTFYPPQQAPYQSGQPMMPLPQMQPPKKKSRLGLWIALGVIGVLLLGCIGTVALIASSVKSTNTGTVVSSNDTNTKSTAPAATNQHFKVGQVVSVGDTWQITINSVKSSKGGEFNKPQKSGDVFLVFNITAKNISSQEQNISSLVQFNLLDKTGQKYSQTIYTDAGASLDGKVEAGSPLRGSIVWEVPASIHDYQMTFESDIASSGQTIWDIHV